MRSDLGSPALAKVREAVMGPNGNNLDDLVRLDGITLKPLISMDFHISAFLHTGDLEAVNALFLLLESPCSLVGWSVRPLPKNIASY